MATLRPETGEGARSSFVVVTDASAPATAVATDSGLPSDGGNEDRFFIVPEGKARAFGAPSASSYWAPSVTDVNAAADAIAPYLTKMKEPRGQDSILAHLSTYRAQFVGVVHGHKRLLAANYFCPMVFDQRLSLIWHSHWIVVLDGGACYFQFTFDPDDKSIHDLKINGYG